MNGRTIVLLGLLTCSAAISLGCYGASGPVAIPANTKPGDLPTVTTAPAVPTGLRGPSGSQEAPGPLPVPTN